MKNDILKKLAFYINYEGRLPIDDDPSDYIKPIKAVKLGWPNDTHRYFTQSSAPDSGSACIQAKIDALAAQVNEIKTKIGRLADDF